MWIRSQDKKILADFVALSLQTSVHNEQTLYVITGHTTNPTAFSANGYAILGIYRSENEAQNEFEKMQASINAKSSMVYQMK